MGQMSDRKRAWRQRLYDAQGGLCIWCGGKMSLTNRRIAGKRAGEPARNFATFEHLTRRRDGGYKQEGNIALAHQKCNRRREDRRYRDAYPDLSLTRTAP